MRYFAPRFAVLTADAGPIRKSQLQGPHGVFKNVEKKFGQFSKSGINVV